MSSLQDLSQETDEAGAKLRALLAVVTAGNTQIESTYASIGTDVEAWTRTAGELDTTLENLVQLSTGGRERVGTACQELKGAFSGLQQWAGTAEQQLTHVDQNFSQLPGELEQTVSAALEGFDAALAALQESRQSLTSQADAVRGIIDTAAQSCTQRFDQFTQAVAQGHEKLSGLQGELETELESISTEISGEILTGANEAVDGLQQAVDGEFKTDLEEHFTKLQTGATEAYTTFTGIVDDAGQHLEDKIKEAAETLADYCKDEALDELKTAIEDKAEEAIEDLIVEIGLDIVMMATGTTVTAAMTAPIPILAGLSAAHMYLKQVNMILELTD